jgi:thiol-disulfide isomerase/thioredoxin
MKTSITIMATTVLVAGFWAIGHAHVIPCTIEVNPISDNIKLNHQSNAVIEDSLVNDSIKVYNFNDFEPLLYSKEKNIKIINFWATWCVPCVKELPFFEEYANANSNVQVLLVSLDFAEDIHSKLPAFIKKRGISSEVVVLDDPNANAWIDKVDPNWSGAIPFTIIFNGDKRLYFERSFESAKDIESVVNELKK